MMASEVEGRPRLLQAALDALRVPDLRARIIFTFLMLGVFRLVAQVPIPGGDQAALGNLFERVQVLGFLDLFSGGALSQCAVGALSIWPYISASIILQLMTAIVPALERLAREGDTGRQKLTQYTRYLTLVICVIQGGFIAVTLNTIHK